MKLSRIQNKDTKPTLKGAYQRFYGNSYDEPFWAYWHGQYWGICYTTMEEAIRTNQLLRPIKGIYQKLKWRGQIDE